MSRKHWEERSALMGTSFRIGEEAEKLSEEILRRARALHEVLFSGKRDDKNEWYARRQEGEGKYDGGSWSNQQWYGKRKYDDNRWE
eukprot:10718860-Karenia_brevis.AAC.1